VEQSCFEEDKRGLWPLWFYSKLNRDKPNKTDRQKYLPGKYISHRPSGSEKKLIQPGETCYRKREKNRNVTTALHVESPPKENPCALPTARQRDKKSRGVVV
jgi:hypothetical protein